MKLSSVVCRKKVLWTSIIVMVLVSVPMINIVSASPDTYFWVDPPVVGHVTLGAYKLIDIKITDAPKTYSWEISLSWDPALLELLAPPIERDFLHRGGAYPTALAHVPLYEANPKGEISITCSLKGELKKGDWADGDGWLCTLVFLAEKEGDVFINLFDTSLADHFDRWGYPESTYYPNIDGFPVTAGVAEAILEGWKLKVNGKAGYGIKTTVDTDNTLEAYVSNIGTFDVDVQVFFDIRDGFFHPIVGSPIPSSVVTLGAGDSTILSVTWAADDADVYYITAYLFYTFYGAVTPNGFSRTLRVEAS